MSASAIFRQIHVPQRNADFLCLRLDEVTTHGVHGHPVRRLIECREEPGDFVLILLPENVPVLPQIGSIGQHMKQAPKRRQREAGTTLFSGNGSTTDFGDGMIFEVTP